MRLLSFTTTVLFIVISVSIKAQNTSATDTIIMASDSDSSAALVEFEATFQGGDVAWKKFLELNLKGDVAAQRGAPAGIYTVWIQFVVDKEGNISDIKPLTNWGYGMEAEVIRLLKKSPKWTPATQNGRPVKAYRKQPVTFQIEEYRLEVYPDNGSVLYIGIDNPITIKALKAKDKNLYVTISQGVIAGGDGRYIARVTTPGRAIIDVYNKNKKLGSVSLEVATIPKPILIKK